LQDPDDGTWPQHTPGIRSPDVSALRLITLLASFFVKKFDYPIKLEV
jgi:hypothetical protein